MQYNQDLWHAKQHVKLGKVRRSGSQQPKALQWIGKYLQGASKLSGFFAVREQ